MTALAVPLLAAGCWNPFATSPDPTVTIWVNHNEALVRWPRDDTTRVRRHNGFDDLNGFAGLEVVVGGTGMPVRTYRASHFASVGEPRFKVPDTGFATVIARIVQGGRTVAEVSDRWELEWEIQWDLHVDRGPYPPGGGIPRDLDNPECRWPTCAFIWRATIDEGASNYEGEALWVVLYRNDPDEW